MVLYAMNNNLTLELFGFTVFNTLLTNTEIDLSAVEDILKHFKLRKSVKNSFNFIKNN